MLDQLVASTTGLICDLGCGPGQVARYLHDRGARVFGADVSEGALREGRRRSPDVPFQCHDMLALGLRTGSLGGATAFYAIVHFSLGQLSLALGEVARVLAPGGQLLFTFHVGDETRHVDELFGMRASADFRFFLVEDVEARVRDAGLELVETRQRDPYPQVEVQTRRAYVLARKPR